VESDAYLETYRFEWSGGYVDGEFFHLLPVRTVLIVVAGALVDEERDDDVGVDFVAHRDHFGFAVSGHDVRVGTGFAERCRTDRSSALDVWLGHGRPFFLTSEWLDFVYRRSFTATRVAQLCWQNCTRKFEWQCA
jgi:hypothetical protein